LSLGNRAAVSAGIAAHAIAIQFFPKRRGAFADALAGGENIAQGGHKYILRLRDWVCLAWTRGGSGSVRSGFHRLGMSSDPHFGLLAGGGDLCASHLGSQPFESNFAVLVTVGERDRRPEVGFG